MTYIIDNKVKPLTPSTDNAYINKLLQTGQAVPIREKPFTIMLIKDI